MTGDGVTPDRVMVGYRCTKCDREFRFDAYPSRAETQVAADDHRTREHSRWVALDAIHARQPRE